ncbi:MAG: redoxin family protein [Alphaproteobacteria bacterium]
MLSLAIKRVAVATATAASVTIAAMGVSMAAPDVNKAAPDFTGTTSDGGTFTLSSMAKEGRKVILEWTNHDCPYVRKHYDTDNMQSLQEDAAERDVVWVTVISSAPGKQGHVSAQEANALTEKRNASPDYVILDESGDIGRLYDAKTTPHMYIVDEDGVLRYMGAIDDKPTSRKSTVEGARNYVRIALGELEAGEAVTEAVTTPYGCSVKY